MQKEKKKKHGAVTELAAKGATSQLLPFIKHSVHHVSYPVCLEDVVEGKERHNSKHHTQQRCLECGPEV